MLKSKVDPRTYAGGLLVAIAVIGLIINDLWPLWLVLLAIAMVMLTTSLVSGYEYQCLKCQGVYKLGAMGALASKHGRDKGGNWAISRCPHCGAVTKAKESRSHDSEKV
ncbi:MAG TPA: hypothetical protein VMW85_04905 [Methanomassiliicoccales archaeon]|nr:hypothetical protein [Methanomassiliicoccales archaeon]